MSRSARRRNRKKIEFNPKYIFILLFIACAVTIFASYRYKEKFAPVKTAFGDFVTPMQKGINTVGSSIANRFRMFSDIKKLIEENDSLKDQIDELKAQNSVLTQEKYELNWYRELYELDQQYQDFDKVAATVINREPNSYCNEFIIDKGSEDGILPDMNVISGNGLVGIITEVGKNWSRVRSIIDDASSVSGMFLTTSDTCIVSGNLELLDEGYINVRMIDLNAEIYDNYEIVTSYISDKYLPGILIGYVSNIRTDSSTMSKEAYLTPVVDFRHIEAVLVITELKEQLEDLDGVVSSDN